MNSIQKDLVDFLRNRHALRACYAHELVAAYFGYRSKASLDADFENFLLGIQQAWLICPNINTLQDRLSRLNTVSSNNLNTASITMSISQELISKGYCIYSLYDPDFNQLSKYILETYLPATVNLGDELSGVMAETNACFDEEYYDSIDIFKRNEQIIIEIKATITGSNHPDRGFCGDEINAEIILTSDLITDFCFYSEPEIEVSGVIKDFQY